MYAGSTSGTLVPQILVMQMADMALLYLLVLVIPICLMMSCWLILLVCTVDCSLFIAISDILVPLGSVIWPCLLCSGICYLVKLWCWFFIVDYYALDLCWFTVLLTVLFPLHCGCAILLPCVLLPIILSVCALAYYLLPLWAVACSCCLSRVVLLIFGCWIMNKNPSGKKKEICQT
jgi:hypothetical protein